MKKILFILTLLFSLEHASCHSRETLRSIKHCAGLISVGTQLKNIFNNANLKESAEWQNPSLPVGIAMVSSGISYELLARALEEDDWYMHLVRAVAQALQNKKSEHRPKESDAVRMVSQLVERNPFFQQFLGRTEDEISRNVLGTERWKSTPFLVFLIETLLRHVSYSLINKLSKSEDGFSRTTRRLQRVFFSACSDFVILTIAQLFHSFSKDSNGQSGLLRWLLTFVGSVAGNILAEVGGELVAQQLLDDDILPVHQVPQAQAALEKEVHEERALNSE